MIVLPGSGLFGSDTDRFSLFRILYLIGERRFLTPHGAGGLVERNRVGGRIGILRHDSVVGPS